MSERILEVCCFSASSAFIAEKCGAHRIEFCDNYFEGGTTPSLGNLKWVIDNISIPVFPIIRPRGGHFVYNKEEFEIIKHDIILCRSLGFEGVVIGMLNESGMVDFDMTAACCEWAWPMEVTFHRAFDRVREPYENLEKIINAGCTRLLTSGRFPDAASGMDMLIKLTAYANNRIIIMPGGGIRTANLPLIVQRVPTNEFHSSALNLQKSQFYSPESMQESIAQPTVNPDEITGMVEILRSFKNHVA